MLLGDGTGRYPNLQAMRGRAEYDVAFLEYVEALSSLYFLEYVCGDPRAAGVIQDRSTFADLLSVGGIRFQLSALVVASLREYLPRAEAAARVLRVLKVLDGPQGPAVQGIARVKAALIAQGRSDDADRLYIADDAIYRNKPPHLRTKPGSLKIWLDAHQHHYKYMFILDADSSLPQEDRANPESCDVLPLGARFFLACGILAYLLPVAGTLFMVLSPLSAIVVSLPWPQAQRQGST